MDLESSYTFRVCVTSDYVRLFESKPCFANIWRFIHWTKKLVLAALKAFRINTIYSESAAWSRNPHPPCATCRFLYYCGGSTYCHALSGHQIGAGVLRVDERRGRVVGGTLVRRLGTWQHGGSSETRKKRDEAAAPRALSPLARDALTTSPQLPWPSGNRKQAAPLSTTLLQLAKCRSHFRLPKHGDHFGLHHHALLPKPEAQTLQLQTVKSCTKPETRVFTK